MNQDILVVGDKDILIGFASIGMDTLQWEHDSFDKMKQTLQTKIQAGVKMIFITEKLFSDLKEFLEIYKDSVYPLFIPIPDLAGSLGVGEKNIQRLIVEALGTDNFGEEN